MASCGFRVPRRACRSTGHRCHPTVRCAGGHRTATHSPRCDLRPLPRIAGTLKISGRNFGVMALDTSDPPGLLLDTSALDVRLWRDTIVVAANVAQEARGQTVQMFYHDRKASCVIDARH